MLSDGREIERVGIQPNMEVKAAPAEFAVVDPVLEAALAHLRQSAANSAGRHFPELHPAVTATETARRVAQSQAAQAL